MTDDPSDEELDRVIGRMQALLADAIAGLDALDLAERIRWCRASGQHGVRLYFRDDDDVLEFRWGNRRLALINRKLLLDDAPFHAEFVEDAPDIVPLNGPAANERTCRPAALRWRYEG
jgi:hypothetical protein